jgi:hypothetical protein
MKAPDRKTQGEIEPPEEKKLASESEKHFVSA